VTSVVMIDKKDEADDNEDWALCYKNNDDLYTMSCRASSGYKAPRRR
jgi:hypothetical protein